VVVRDVDDVEARIGQRQFSAGAWKAKHLAAPPWPSVPSRFTAATSALRRRSATAASIALPWAGGFP
jgi:hypothetical protein